MTARIVMCAGNAIRHKTGDCQQHNILVGERGFSFSVAGAPASGRGKAACQTACRSGLVTLGTLGKGRVVG
jgi:hypothetical protein